MATDELFAGLDRLVKGVKSVQLQRAINEANDRSEQIRNSELKTGQKRAQLQNLSTLLAGKMIGLNVDPASTKLLSDKLKPQPFGSVQNALFEAALEGDEEKVAEIQQAGVIAEQPSIRAENRQFGKQVALSQMKIEASREHVVDESLIPNNIDPRKLPVEIRERFVSGLGTGSSKEAVNQFKKVSPDLMSAISAVDRLSQISRMPMKSMNLALRAEAQTLQSAMVGKLRIPLTGGGPLTAEEQVLIREVAADPTALFSFDVKNKAKIKVLQRILKKDLQFRADAAGFVNPDIKAFIRGRLRPGASQFNIRERLGRKSK